MGRGDTYIAIMCSWHSWVRAKVGAFWVGTGENGYEIAAEGKTQTPGSLSSLSNLPEPRLPAARLTPVQERAIDHFRLARIAPM